MSYFDIIVHGSTREECQHNLIASLDQHQKFDLHLNQQKCLLFQEQIKYLGHVNEFNKVSKSQGKVCGHASPKINRRCKKIPGNASTITTPLRHLLCKNTIFKWTSACEASFLILKQAIASDKVLVPYDPDLPVQLACDASLTGIAGVLSHIYLFCCHFKLITDNQPLTRIFNHRATLPKMTAGHLQCYTAFLSGFNYTIDFKKGIENSMFDCLSRAPIKINSYTASAINNEVKQLCDATIEQLSIPTVTYQLLKEEMEKDATLSTIMKSLQEENTSEPDYIIESGILFCGQRVVPASLQSAVLNKLHQNHVGITKVKQLAHLYVYWKKIDSDIEHLVRSCSECVAIKNSSAKAPSHPWEEPEHNWQRIHIDYASPYQDHHFLVVADAKSKWAEIVPCSSAPTSKSNIEFLKDIFSRNGFPEVMISDNATIFTSEEFAQFCKEAGVFQKFCAAGHPATNSPAERNVQMLKH
ncbi:hypothetical protein PR048_009027 [Dryococelus australis]|uniref:RNA-directed DNA polymerase n=1 Tax=Dryococelus australis TaxID=614101 RepID=A0ABQ9HYR6_9NEOP|nr:hypothetical protein PR048_009027 [Dryococelus australis]